MREQARGKKKILEKKICGKEDGNLDLDFPIFFSINLPFHPPSHLP